MRVVRLILGLAVLCLPAASAAEIVVVDYDGVGGVPTIQAGIDAASDGDEVWVLSFLSTTTVTFRGTGNTDLDLQGKNISIVATEGPEQTVIDCEGASRAFIVGSGVDSTSLISGFTIENGYAVDTGGAVLCEGGSPRISECVFRNNGAPVGAAVKFDGGAASVSDCEFYGNTAVDRGGAISVKNADISVRRCTFASNDGQRGGGMSLENSDLTLFRTTMANNRGALGSSLFLENTTATVEQCVLAFGRGSSAVWGGAPETFHSCVFGNSSGDSLPGSPHDNINADPLVCDLLGQTSGAMSLCTNSPCLPANNAWSLPVGSKTQGCGDCDSPVEGATWGAIKALYR